MVASRTSIMDWLARGEKLLMDGGTGSELQRRGVDVLIGASAEQLGAWSAPANIEAPDAVRQVHLDFLDAGADILISNSFWTSPSRLAAAGLADRWEEYARAAGEIAVRARDDRNPHAWIFGGMAPPCAQGARGKPDPDVELLGEELVLREFADHARVLAAAGVDVILPEYVGHIADCVAAVEACATAGLPVFLGVRHVTIEGTMQYGESIQDMVDALRGRPVAAVLLMCSKPEATSATLPKLRSAFDGPIGAYSQVGYDPLAPLRLGRPDPTGPGEYPPDALAQFAEEWLDMGAQIVGGCCATTPEHIAAMGRVVKP